MSSKKITAAREFARLTGCHAAKNMYWRSIAAITGAKITASLLSIFLRRAGHQSFWQSSPGYPLYLLLQLRYQQAPH